MESSSKLLAIVGPTSSGKSDLAIRVASDVNAEIICADSRTIYKEMNIGTAKPSISEQGNIPHWGLDLINPGEFYSVKLYQQYAKQKVVDIHSRQRLPIVVGGTGLYIDSLLYDYEFTDTKSLYKRQDLEKLSLNELHRIIRSHSYQPPENYKNKRHLIRTIERGGTIGTKKGLMEGAIVIGLLPSDEKLKQNIKNRAEAMFSRGVVDETQQLVNSFGGEAVLSTGGIIYKICIQILDGEIDERRGIELFRNADWQYARRQRTWFKRNPDIKWFSNKAEAYLHLRHSLNT